MANAAETLVSAGNEKERKSGEFDKAPEGQERPETFEKLEGEAIADVERMAKEAMAYALAEGQPDLVAEIQTNTEAAKTEVRQATDEGAAKAGVTVDRPAAKEPSQVEESPEKQEMVKKVTDFVDREIEGFQQQLNRLDEEQRRTGSVKGKKINTTREVRQFGMRLRENPVALAAIAAIMATKDRDPGRVEAAMIENVPWAGDKQFAARYWSEMFLGEKKSVAQKEERKAAEAKLQAEKERTIAEQAKEESKAGFWSSAADRGKSAAVVGAAAGFGLTGFVKGALGVPAFIFEKLDKFLGIFTGGKGFLNGLEGALDWITKKFGGKTSDKKHED